MFRIHHVFIDDEGRAFGIGRNALSDLATQKVSVGLHTWGGAQDGEDIPNGPKLAEEVEKLLWRNVVAGSRRQSQGETNGGSGVRGPGGQNVP